jgi:hypothetical protein
MAEVADHFYTTDPNGEGAQSSGYVREGIAFFAFPTQLAGTVPLFRLFGRGGDHFYTTDAGEADFAVSGGYEREQFPCLGSLEVAIIFTRRALAKLILRLV